jgi:fluoride exporter
MTSQRSAEQTAAVTAASVAATDPDVDLHVPADRRELARHPVAVLAAMSAGGALGALARYGISVAVPTPTGAFPWATFLINVTGCFLIGVLMVIITELATPHPLARPFLGVGVLGGYTTFSTSVVEVQRLVAAGAAGTGLLYVAATALTALAAAYLGTVLARRVGGLLRRKAAA